MQSPAPLEVSVEGFTVLFGHPLAPVDQGQPQCLYLLDIDTPMCTWQALAEEIQAAGGIITAQDLTSAQPTVKPAISSQVGCNLSSITHLRVSTCIHHEEQAVSVKLIAVVCFAWQPCAMPTGKLVRRYCEQSGIGCTACSQPHVMKYMLVRLGLRGFELRGFGFCMLQPHSVHLLSEAVCTLTTLTRSVWYCVRLRACWPSASDLQLLAKLAGPFFNRTG